MRITRLTGNLRVAFARSTGALHFHFKAITLDVEGGGGAEGEGVGVVVGVDWMEWGKGKR